MIDTAIPDVVSDGLINFDKRRKEFEVLAQVGVLAIWKYTEEEEMVEGGRGKTREGSPVSARS